MAEKTSSETTCPLCGANNQCAIAAGKPAETCWCFNRKLDEEALTKAAAITDAQCVCPACGQVEKTPE